MSKSQFAFEGAELARQAMADVPFARIVPNSSVANYPNEALFHQYDELKRQLVSLSDVDVEQMQTQQAIQLAEANLHQLTNQLQTLSQTIRKLEQKIDRNENEFFHKFQIGRKKKIHMIQQQLQQYMQQQQTLTTSRAQAQSDLNAAWSRSQQVAQQKSRKDALENQCHAMFEQVVQSAPKSVQTLQIEQAIVQQDQICTQEANLLDGVTNVFNLISQAQGLFNKSLELNHRALQANQRAEIANFGPGFGFEFYEKMNQFNRDDLMRESMKPAADGVMVLSQAFHLIPPYARTRYPDLTSRVGNVPIPTIQAQSSTNTAVNHLLLGDVGDFINTRTTARKIETNLRTINQCVQITAQQHAAILALMNAVSACYESMAANRCTLSKQLHLDKERIFDNVRNEVAPNSTLQRDNKFSKVV